jgi:hypothetical protein
MWSLVHALGGWRKAKVTASVAEERPATAASEVVGSEVLVEAPVGARVRR